MMKKLFYVRSAKITLFEAYPDDPKIGWMRGGHDLKYPGKYSTLNELLAYVSPNNTYRPITHWGVSSIRDGGFLMTTNVLVDHQERKPSPERLAAWKTGKAQLYYGFYAIEVNVENVEFVSASEIRELLGVPEQEK